MESVAPVTPEEWLMETLPRVAPDGALPISDRDRRAKPWQSQLLRQSLGDDGDLRTLVDQCPNGVRSSRAILMRAVARRIALRSDVRRVADSAFASSGREYASWRRV